MDINEYVTGVLIGLDDFATSILFSGSQHDITISARCGMAQIDALRGTIRLNEREQFLLTAGATALDAIDERHCFEAIQGDRDRALKMLAMLEPYLAYIDAQASTP